MRPLDARDCTFARWQESDESIKMLGLENSKQTLRSEQVGRSGCDLGLNFRGRRGASNGDE
jgi:hypothetical protein